jgi:hypothetical protein
MSTWESPAAVVMHIFSEASVGHPAPLLYKPTLRRSSVYQGFSNLPTRKMRKANACVYVCVLLVLIAALEWQVSLAILLGLLENVGVLYIILKVCIHLFYRLFSAMEANLM